MNRPQRATIIPYTSAAAVWGVVPASLRPTLDGRGEHHAVQAASAAAANGPSLAMERLCRRIRLIIRTVALRVYCACERRRRMGAVGAGNGDRGGARQPLPHVLAQERQQRRRQVGTLRQHCHARADPSGLSSISIRSASSGSGAQALQSCSACARWSARSGATAADASVSMSPGMVRWSASDMKRLSRRTSCSPAVSNASSVVAGSDSCNACARR